MNTRPLAHHHQRMPKPAVAMRPQQLLQYLDPCLALKLPKPTAAQVQLRRLRLQLHPPLRPQRPAHRDRPVLHILRMTQLVPITYRVIARAKVPQHRRRGGEITDEVQRLALQQLTEPLRPTDLRRQHSLHTRPIPTQKAPALPHSRCVNHPVKRPVQLLRPIQHRAHLPLITHLRAQVLRAPAQTSELLQLRALELIHRGAPRQHQLRRVLLRQVPSHQIPQAPKASGDQVRPPMTKRPARPGAVLHLYGSMSQDLPNPSQPVVRTLHLR